MGNIVRISAIAILLFCITNTYAEVNTTGSTVDNNGNIIVIGYCLGNVRIAGQEYTITQPSVYILKLNPDGEMIWLKFATSSGSITGNAVSVDSSGSIYITGEFSGTASFDSYSLTAQGTDAFIVKYNSSGITEWVKHGTSPGTASGNDIFVKGNLILTCGYGQPISFDSLSTTGGGFTVIYNSDGNIVNLFNSQDISHKLTVDANADIIIFNKKNNFPSLCKYSLSGELIWQASGFVEIIIALCIDASNSIYTFGRSSISNDLLKYNNLGNYLSGRIFSPPLTESGDIMLTVQNQVAFTGYFSSGFQFGDSILQSNGLNDFFIAVVDTNLNPVWIKQGGGVYDDEMNSVFQLNDGHIVCGGNFRGTIQVDSLEISGGISPYDKWVGIAKYDIDGNLILLKKIAENISTPSPIIWFPLEVGNKFQYFGDNFGQYYLNLFQVGDSVLINDKKYFSVSDFPWSTKIRYDEAAKTIIVLYQNQEYVYMDFSKEAGETFMQIQHNGSFRNTTIVDENFVILGDTVEAKGFYNSYCVWGGITYLCYYTWCYFAPEIGLIFQKKKTNYQTGEHISFSIEYLIIKEGQPIHKKHTETATLFFQPVTFIAEGDSLYQGFIILHPFSKQNVPASYGYFSYMNAYLQSFYFNGTDTLWNPEFQIQQTTEKDFTLNYQFDTTKYQQGYHLYYRIAAVDKGIIADTFYSPPTGYYKLYWRDSTTSVTQISPEIFDYSLSQNYPNPFNPSAKISFSIPEREFVSLKVFDILGSEITTLVNKEIDAGKYEVDFDGKNLSSGIYIYQLRSGNFINTKKMLLIK